MQKYHNDEWWWWSPSRFMIQSSQQVWSAGGGGCQVCLNPVWWVSGEGERSDHRAKLDSDKWGDEAGDQTFGLIESCTRLKFYITQPVSFHTEWPYQTLEEWWNLWWLVFVRTSSVEESEQNLFSWVCWRPKKWNVIGYAQLLRRRGPKICSKSLDFRLLARYSTPVILRTEMWSSSISMMGRLLENLWRWKLGNSFVQKNSSSAVLQFCKRFFGVANLYGIYLLKGQCNPKIKLVSNERALV